MGKDSELYGLFRYHLLKLRQSGLLHGLQRKHFHALDTEAAVPDDLSPIGWPKVAVLFGALCLGVAASVALALAERLVRAAYL